MNVTEVPAQTVLAVAEMETPTINEGSTIMVTGLLGAGLPETQFASDEVSTQLTTSPFNGV